MSLFPEREVKPYIEEVPEEISPLTIERKEVVQPVLTQFKKRVKTDDGKSMIQTPSDKVISITIPGDQGQLTTLSKGSVSDSITWLAAYWLRMIKKAIHFGWKIFSGSLGRNPEVSKP